MKSKKNELEKTQLKLEGSVLPFLTNTFNKFKEFSNNTLEMFNLIKLNFFYFFYFLLKI